MFVFPIGFHDVVGQIFVMKNVFRFCYIITILVSTYRKNEYGDYFPGPFFEWMLKIEPQPSRLHMNVDNRTAILLIG